MSSSENGIRQSPFDKAWPTPDVSGTGANGIGGGLDAGSGPNGIINSPFDKAEAAPGISVTPCADLGEPSPFTVDLGEGAGAGAQIVGDITSSRNTIDKR